METKVCKKCGRELPVAMFYKASNRKDGLQIYCKECQAEVNKESNKRRNRAAKVAKAEAEALYSKGLDPNRPLAKFTPRELMEELKARGYSGTLTFTKYISLSSL